MPKMTKKTSAPRGPGEQPIDLCNTMESCRIADAYTYGKSGTSTGYSKDS